METGKWIRTLREERSIKPSDIERATRTIAESRGNADFYVSHSTLADIEAGSVPSIHKLFSLAVAFKVPLGDLLVSFGIDLSEVTSPAPEPANETLKLAGPPERDPTFRFQLNFDTNVSSGETTLLQIQTEDIAHLPPALRARFDPIRYRYAVIGLKDDAMVDLLPPRSLVEIDTEQRIVQVFVWRALRERPIYLVWHPEGHSCCWCQLDGKDLTLIPHPLSQQRVRRFRMPNEATIIGKVTNAWLPFDSFRVPPQFNS